MVLVSRFSLRRRCFLTLVSLSAQSYPSADHYIYVNEYLWQILEAKNAMATMTSILDLQGLNFNYIREKEIVNFMKEFVKTMDSHYPQRAHKTLIVNAPKWFHVLYKIVSPLLRESTKSKIEIYTRGKRQDKALKTWLGNDQAEKLLPASFFSKKKQHKNKKGKRKHDRKMMKEASEEEPVADDEENEEDLPSPDEDAHLASSQFEIDLRTFVSLSCTMFPWCRVI
jgi:CRAL/TRIO domain